MIVKVLLGLVRDSANSEPGEAEVQPFNSGSKQLVMIKLGAPKREIWLDRRELKKALELTCDEDDRD